MAAQQKRRRVPPPGWFAIAWGAQWLVARKRRSTALSRTVFVTLTTASGLFALTAVSEMSRAGTQVGPEHPERSKTLVTAGPFRFTRNPIYLALAGALVAHALLRRSVASLAPAAGFIAVLDRTQVPAEERALQSRFGRSYDRYRRATPRWIGPPRRSGRALGG